MNDPCVINKRRDINNSHSRFMIGTMFAQLSLKIFAKTLHIAVHLRKRNHFKAVIKRNFLDVKNQFISDTQQGNE